MDERLAHIKDEQIMLHWELYAVGREINILEDEWYDLQEEWVNLEDERVKIVKALEKK